MLLEGIVAAALELSLAVLASLLALRLVLGRQHWIVRLGTLLGFVAPLAWAGVHDFLVIWGTSVIALFLISTTIATCKRLYTMAKETTTDSRAPAQFTLTKLLIGTIPAALLFAELHYTSLEPQDLIGNVEIGIAWGIVAAWVWLARFGSAPFGVHWLPLLISAPLLGYALDLAGLGKTVPSQLSGGLLSLHIYFLISTCLQAMLLLLALYLWKWLPLVGTTQAIGSSESQRLPRSIKRLDSIIRRSAMAMALVIFGSIVAPGAMLYVYMAATPRPIVPAEPNPNVYELLVEAGRKLNAKDAPNADPREATGSALAAVISTNQSLLDSVHAAALGESRVPLSYHPRDIDAAVSNAAIFRQLGRTLIGEANFHQYKGHTDQAAQASLDCIRIALLSERGGLIINSLVGIAINGVGVARLHEQIPLLDAAKCREISAVLQKLERDFEPVEDVIQRDHLWCRIAFGWRGQSSVLAEQLTRNSSPGYQATRAAHLRRTAMMRILITELMVRAYDVEQQQFPDSLHQLMPGYLTSIPVDPYDDRPLRYRRTVSGSVVYSVGADGIDDGGKRIAPQQLFDPGTDLSFENFIEISTPQADSGQPGDVVETLEE